HSSPDAPSAASEPASAACSADIESAAPSAGFTSWPSPRMTGVGVSKECSEARDIVSPDRPLVPDTWIDKGVDHVHQNVHERQEDPIDEHHRHDHRLILGQHALHIELAHSGDVEHLLHEEGSGANGGKD